MLPLYIALESAITDQFFRVLATLKRKFNVLCFHAVLGTREDLSIDESITNVELIWTKLGWFLFSGYKQTNQQTQFWSPQMETCQNSETHKKIQLNT